MTYDLNLTQQELVLIFQALGELPLKVTLNLFSKLQAEMQRQDEAKAVPVEEVVP